MESESETAAVVSDTSPRSPRQAVLWMTCATLLLFVLMFALEPLLFRLFRKTPGFVWQHSHEPLDQLLIRRGLEALTLLWFFMLGGSFGSFLHCVVYRVPRGISVAASGSCCPGCGSKIKAWHNVPLFGWLLLRGECAACGWIIPVRYPLAELLFGSVFLLLMIPELVMGGANLPGMAGPFLVSVAETVWFPQWQLLQSYAYHAVLLTSLMTASLFALDRVPLPRSIVWICTVLLTAVPLLGMPVLPLSIQHSIAPTTDLFENGLREIVGGLLGGVLGMLCLRRQPRNMHPGDAETTIFGLGIVGLSLGWQSAVSIALLSFLPRLIVLLFPSRWGWSSHPLVIWITLASCLHIVLWRWWLTVPHWPGHAQSGLEIILAPLLLMALSYVVDVWES
jgi:prepilin signal peptidase PulO-like enzyme (type II secretory pathway)